MDLPAKSCQGTTPQGLIALPFSLPMKQTISTYRIPIKLWLDDIDPQALEQAKHLAELPCTVEHIAIMPDSHVGYGMPIGGVMATRDTVIPNGVGVDIGCGVCAVQTSLRRLEADSLDRIMSQIDENDLYPKKLSHFEYFFSHIFMIRSSHVDTGYESCS